MFVGLDVELAALVVVEPDEIERRQVAGGVVQKKIFRAWVRSPYATTGRTGVPLVDRGVELETRVRTGPRSLGYARPQIACLDRLADRTVGSIDQVPVIVLLHGLDEVVADADRVVGVLPRDSGISLTIEIGREATVVDEQLGLLFLDLLPVDELLDVGMVDIENDHLGCATGSATRLDRAGGAVPDLEEGHDPGGLATTREQFVLPSDGGEVGSGAGAELEDASLPHPQVHDSTRVDQVIADAEYVAGMRSGSAVGVRGGYELLGLVIDVPQSLGWAGEPVGPVESGVEPLW